MTITTLRRMRKSDLVELLYDLETRHMTKRDRSFYKSRISLARYHEMIEEDPVSKDTLVDMIWDKL